MTSYTNYADLIKNSLTMHRMLEFYGFDIRHERIPCPFHNGKDRNLAFKDGYYKCFVCGESGDLIDFEMKYFHLDFQGAIRQLDRDFHLGLNLELRDKPSLRENRSCESRANKFAEIAREKQFERELFSCVRDLALDRYVSLTQQIIKYRPKTVTEFEHPHKLYIYAVKHINEALENLEEAETRLYLHEHQR